MTNNNLTKLLVAYKITRDELWSGHHKIKATDDQPELRIYVPASENNPMINVCERCRRHTVLIYVRRCDAYLCEECEEAACEEIEISEPEDV